MRLLIIAILISCIGCTSLKAETMEQKLSKVNYSDGVSKEDAVVIAQDYLLKHKISVSSAAPTGVISRVNRYRSRENSSLYVENKEYQDKDVDVWVVSFRCRQAFGIASCPIYIHIDKKNGYVIIEKMDCI